MYRRAFVFLLPASILAACGSDDGTVTLRGDFAGDVIPTRVLAMEAEREAEVRDGAFELSGLSAGPVTLRLLSGDDTVGTMALRNVPTGTELGLRRLRVDGATGRAFPTSLDLAGSQLVVVNGLRMAGSHRLPREVDEAGTILSATDAADAFLLRPDDDDLPDLRVVLSPGADVVTPDGDPVDADRIGPGDSVRVEGPTESGFVLATRVTVPRGLAVSARDAAPGGGGEGASSEDDGSDDGEGDDDASSTVIAAPVRGAPEVRVREDRGARGKGRGQERGGGRGGGKKKS